MRQGEAGYICLYQATVENLPSLSIFEIGHGFTAMRKSVNLTDFEYISAHAKFMRWIVKP